MCLPTEVISVNNFGEYQGKVFKLFRIGGLGKSDRQEKSTRGGAQAYRTGCNLDARLRNAKLVLIQTNDVYRRQKTG
jgi:hypothetical protein